MKKALVSTVCLATVLLATFVTAAEKRPMAKLCGMCHEPEPGVMMGFLENIAIKSGTIQMDFMTHKEVVKFNDETAVKYVRDFKDIRNYKKKGFQINYVERDGEKLATEIIRFDILKVIEDDEKLSRAEFQMLRKDPKVAVFDVRPPMKYKMGHIPGAGLIPAPAFDKFVGKLPKDKAAPVIFYGVGGCLSPTALMKTRALGYTDVRIYTGGFPDWSRHEYGVVAVDWLKMAIAKGIPHVLIDLRPGSEVVKGHIQGAVAIDPARLESAKDMFPERKKAPIIFYGPDSEKAAKLAISWGYTAVRVLPIPFAKWQEMGNPVQSGPAAESITYTPKPRPGTVSVALFEQMVQKQPADVILVDVRNPDELEEGSVKTAINIPVDLIGERVAELDKNKEIILFCNTGIRAEMAHTVLMEKGVKSRFLDATVTFDGDELEVEEN